MTSQLLTDHSRLSTSSAPAWRRLWLSSLATSPALAPVFLRLTLAVVMFPHGAQKLLGWFGGYGFEGTMGFFGSLGLPAPLSALVILIEFFAPIFLVLGLATRWSAAGLLAIMLGAITTVHAQHGFFMNWYGAQQGEGFEYHLLVVGIAAALIAQGSGRYGLDARLTGRGDESR